MSKSMLERAKDWVEKSSPSPAELLASHNNIVKQVVRGATNADESEQTLDYLGELYVEAEGDPVDLLSVDGDDAGTEAPGSNQPGAGASSAVDATLVNYDADVTAPALQGEEKAAMFALLREKVGVKNVPAR